MQRHASTPGFETAVFFGRTGHPRLSWVRALSRLVVLVGPLGCVAAGSVAERPPAAAASPAAASTESGPSGSSSEAPVSTTPVSSAAPPAAPLAAVPAADSVAPPPDAAMPGEPPQGDQARRAPLALPAGTKVLHVGDSFAGALGIPLGELLEQAGVRSILKHKDSSYLTTWAWEPELAQEIWRYNPDLVVVTLGANELGIADPGQREKTVRKIVSTIGDRPCLWVAIPLWSARHNGLLEVIEASSSPCVFYDTNERMDTLQMPRIHDGIHPTNAARRAWAQAVFEFLEAHRRPEDGKPWRLAAELAPSE